MEAQSYTAQERRAANQVWAAAGEYGFEPLFLARNTDSHRHRLRKPHIQKQMDRVLYQASKP